jgi:hypothetical protein
MMMIIIIILLIAHCDLMRKEGTAAAASGRTAGMEGVLFSHVFIISSIDLKSLLVRQKNSCRLMERNCWQDENRRVKR